MTMYTVVQSTRSGIVYVNSYTKAALESLIADGRFAGKSFFASVPPEETAMEWDVDAILIIKGEVAVPKQVTKYVLE